MRHGGKERHSFYDLFTLLTAEDALGIEHLLWLGAAGYSEHEDLGGHVYECVCVFSSSVPVSFHFTISSLLPASHHTPTLTSLEPQPPSSH